MVKDGNESMYCRICGTALPDAAAFCHACGAKVSGGEKAGTMELYPVRCTACGSSSLKKIRKDEYRCEYCGTVFYTNEQSIGEDHESTDAKVAVLLAEAAAFAEKKDYNNELQTLIKAKELDPENDFVLLRLGRVYWKLGSLEKAMEYYQIAEELYPNDPTVYNNIGSNYFKMGQYAKANEQYEKAIALIEADPTSANGEDVAITYGNYAYSLGKLGDRKNAKKYLSLAKEKGYSTDSINTICKELHLFRFLL